MIPATMQDLLRQIDLDYYRSTRLLIAHAELEQLRQLHPVGENPGAARNDEEHETAP